MPIRQAVILVGGLGTRLGEHTRTTPKPMLEVAGRPFIEHVMAQVTRFAIDRVLLLAGFRGEAFRDAYEGRQMFGADVRVAVEPEPLGTGGALRFAAGQLDPAFLLVNGDTFFDADFGPMLRRAEAGEQDAWLALRSVDDPSRYGQVIVAGDGRVTDFREKAAALVEGSPSLINAGAYALDRELVLGLVGAAPCSFEKDVLPRLVAEGRLWAHECDGYFIDIGIPDSLAEARETLERVRRRPVAFLDRDGVLNLDDGYTYRIEDLRLVEDAPAAVRRLNDAGYYTIVVSNQAGIARGYYSEEQARAFNQHLRERLMAEGARIDAVYFCPHHPGGTVADLAVACACRKPEPGMLERAAREWPIEREASFLIGDTASDLEAAHRFGIASFQHHGGSLLATVEAALAGTRT